MKIEENRTKHVVMYAMLKWYVEHKDIDYLPIDPDIVITSGLHEREGPLRFYPRHTIQSTLYELEEAGYVKNIEYYGKNIGYYLTDDGAEKLEEIGVPNQYDH